MSSQVISIIGIIIGLACLVYFSFKSLNIYLNSFLFVFIVALTGGLNIYETFTTTYIEGFTGFIKSNFFVFAAGTIMGQCALITGGAKAIARGVVKAFGKKGALLAVPIACLVLSYGGVSAFVVGFTVFPIALELFRENDAPRRLIISGICFGGATVAMCGPGAPQVQNSIPAGACGVSLMAGATAGFIGCAVTLAVGCFWYLWMIKNAQKKGEHFIAKDGDFKTDEDERPIPPFWSAIVPLIVTLILINTICPLEVGVLIGAVLMVAMNLKYYPEWKKEFLPEMGKAVANALMFIGSVSAIAGVGGVVKATPGFELVVNGLQGISSNGLIGAAIGTMVLAGITASASGGLGVAAPILSEMYLGTVPAAALSRIMSMASITFDSMPHSGGIAANIYGIGRETHKTAYIPIMNLCLWTPCIGLIVSIILFTLFPAWP